MKFKFTANLKLNLGERTREFINGLLLAVRKRRVIILSAKIHHSVCSVYGDLIKMMIKDDEQVTISFGALDAKGKPTKFNGTPTVGSSDESVGTAGDVQFDGELYSVDLIAQAPGNARYTITGDPGEGEGDEPLIGFFDLEVVAGDAASINITAGAPRKQPTATTQTI